MKTKIFNVLDKVKQKHPKLQNIKISFKEKEDYIILKIKSGLKKHKIIIDKNKENQIKKLTPKQLETLLAKNLSHLMEEQSLPMIQMIGIALEYTLSPGKHNLKELFD